MGLNALLNAFVATPGAQCPGQSMAAHPRNSRAEEGGGGALTDALCISFPSGRACARFNGIRASPRAHHRQWKEQQGGASAPWALFSGGPSYSPSRVVIFFTSSNISTRDYSFLRCKASLVLTLGVASWSKSKNIRLEPRKSMFYPGAFSHGSR